MYMPVQALHVGRYFKEVFIASASKFSLVGLMYVYHDYCRLFLIKLSLSLSLDRRLGHDDICNRQQPPAYLFQATPAGEQAPTRRKCAQRRRARRDGGRCERSGCCVWRSQCRV